MSEQNNKQSEKQPSRSSTRQRSSSNPLGGSPLLDGGPPAPRPDLPTFSQPGPGSTSAALQQSSAPAGTQQRDLLYNTPPPPEYTLRAFEQRHDRQTIYIDARKAGAIDALVQLVARKNKTDLVDEMVNDILAKYAQTLQENAEMVHLLEEKYRKKHNL